MLFAAAASTDYLAVDIRYVTTAEGQQGSVHQKCAREQGLVAAYALCNTLMKWSLTNGLQIFQGDHDGFSLSPFFYPPSSVLKEGDPILFESVEGR